ncbi:MAG TPA: 50S ribosomal protein L11 methyltransferase [Myxococcales bacterium]|nr:50S ribosomal protein L11 methyltransferase [Myxococcales bacterium]
MVTAAFDDGQPEGLEDRVEQFLHLIDREGAAELQTALGDGPWLAGWRAIYQGVDIKRFRIRPPWMAAPEDGLLIVVDPRGAFGSGLHPSTRIALMLLDTARGKTMLDVGAGSGILSVACTRLGFEAICAAELEPSAREACARTARENGVTVKVLEAMPAERFDLVVANMPAATLRKLAADLRAAVAPGGRLIVSGTRSEDLPGLLRALGGETRELRSPDGSWAAAEITWH